MIHDTFISMIVGDHAKTEATKTERTKSLCDVDIKKEKKEIGIESSSLTDLPGTTLIKTNNSRDSGNRLLHWDSSKKLKCSSMQCSNCGSEVTLNEKKIGIATEAGLTYTNERYNVKDENKAKRTKSRKYNSNAT